MPLFLLFFFLLLWASELLSGPVDALWRAALLVVMTPHNSQVGVALGHAGISAGLPLELAVGDAHECEVGHPRRRVCRWGYGVHTGLGLGRQRRGRDAASDAEQLSPHGDSWPQVYASTFVLSRASWQAIGVFAYFPLLYIGIRLCPRGMEATMCDARPLPCCVRVPPLLTSLRSPAPLAHQERLVCGARLLPICRTLAAPPLL